jgi:hypothetical protein
MSIIRRWCCCYCGLELERIQRKMARFLGGLNEEIYGFVEILPYHTFARPC